MTLKLSILAVIAIMLLNGCNVGNNKKVNGCSYEELAYSQGYAEGTKALNEYEERNAALYILKGSCSGSSYTYSMLKTRYPDKYPQSADSIFELCVAGSQDGFDKKEPQDYYKKECEDKPFINKSEY